LIPFSAQYLMLRGFYAFEDTKTPFTVNIWIAAINGGVSIIAFYALQNTRWAVAGMAAAYAIAYAVGLAITASKLKRKLRGLDRGRALRTYARLSVASGAGAIVAFGVARLAVAVVGEGLPGSLLSLVFGGGAMALVFLAVARSLRIAELDALLRNVRARLGRRA
jgi:putative peptidoglycan lipid II flippase